jgi:hypothetical protein
MKHEINLTEQEILVVVNALENAAAENRSRYASGEVYEKGNVALIDDAEEQEALAKELSKSLTGVLPIDKQFSLDMPSGVGPFNF